MVTVADISQKLSNKALEVCKLLLPGGKEDGQFWVCGDIAGSPGKSLKVAFVGSYVGNWRDWADDSNKGDLLDLWRITKGITAAQAIKEAKHYLGINDPVDAKKKDYRKPVNSIPELATEGRGVAYLTNARHLKLDIIRKFRVEGVRERQAIVFPCYAPDGELINRSYRTLTDPKQVWQEKDCAPCMFGWHALNEQAYKDKTILICEGQIDCMTWTQWGVDSISIPNGTGTAWVEYEWDNLAPFDTIYLAFDQDKAGRELTDKIIQRLGKHRCMIVSMPKKDANDCLKSGYTQKDALDWIGNAKMAAIHKFVRGDELEERVVASYTPKEEAFTLPFFKGDWHEGTGFYFRPGELTVWGGLAFAGKSTMLNFLKANVVSKRRYIFEATMEMLVENQIGRLAKVCMGHEINEPKLRRFCQEIGRYLLFADVVGSIAMEELMEMLWFANRRYGCTDFIIDSMMRIKGQADMEKQAEIVNTLQNFVKESGSHVHLVCHFRKPVEGERPTMYHVKGSSALIDNPDNVAIIIRNKAKDDAIKAGKSREIIDAMHDTEVIIEKQRVSGWVGSFKLKYHKNTFSFSAASK